MRILLHTLNFFPELTGVGKYSGEMAFWLAERGHDVRVVAGHPYFPEWRVREPYRPFEVRQERVGEVDILRVPLWVPSSPGGVKRALHLASFSLACAPALLSCAAWSPQVVVTVVPTFAAAPWALALARQVGAVSWIHLQDLELDAAVDLGLLRPGRLMSTLSKVEAAVLKRFDRVSTLSEEMASILRLKGVVDERLYMLPNWIDTRAVSPGDRDTRIRRELSIEPSTKVVLYSGSIGRKQGLGILIELATVFRDAEGVQFLIAGEGPGLDELKRRGDALTNVRFIPLQPAERLSELLNSADVHFLAQLPQAQGLVLPSKVIGMLASGIPILAAAAPRSALGEIVSHAGFARAHDDVAGLAADLRRILMEPELAASLGAAGRELAMTRFQQADILSRFEAELEVLVDHPK